jgi:hypothetical protein
MAVPPFLGTLSGCLLKQVIIPGSHDAGLSRNFQQDLSIVSSPAKTVTQSDGVLEQARAGSRFFDVRIQKIGGELKSFHTAPNLLGKVPLVKNLKATKTDTRTMGASGEGFMHILDDLRGFVQGSTEFVIVRLSHLKDSADVFQDLWNWIEQPANSQYVYKGTGNLANKRVGDLAGTLVFVIEAKKFKHAVTPPGGGPARVPGQADGFHRFYQSKGGNLPDVLDGLCVCGEFSNKKSLGDIMKKQIDNYSHHDQHKNHRAEQAHLYSLYWTATGGNIEQNTSRELTPANFKQVRELVNATVQKNWSDKLGAHKDVLQTPGSHWLKQQFDQANLARTKFSVKSASIPNIILYDFVNDTISQQIIDLNALVAR